MSKTLVNFLVNQDELDRFDAVASMLNRTRTSVLTEMMGLFCSEQILFVEQRNRKLENLNHALTQQHLLQAQADEARQLSRINWREDNDMGLPTPLMSDGQEHF